MSKTHRSVIAVIVEEILKLSDSSQISSATVAKAYMKKRSLVEDRPLHVKISKYGKNAAISNYQGMQLVTFGKQTTSDYTILYFHGGGYVDEIRSEHLRFCNKLARKLNAYIVIPIYPLAPNHNYRHTYELITALYKDILNRKHNDITIMGDSAGGGFSLAFCQFLKIAGIIQPVNLIVLSPWVDISMSGTKYDKYKIKDPYLGVEGAREMGKIWAGDLDTKNPLVSPIFGSNIGLPDTLIFVGTHEIFYPDIIDYYEKLKEDGVKADLIVGDKMDHVYPILPIPEADLAMKQIIQRIKGY